MARRRTDLLEAAREVASEYSGADCTVDVGFDMGFVRAPPDADAKPLKLKLTSTDKERKP